MALLKRAMADIPRIEQLEKDHPRMARLFQKGLLPFGIWEQLVDAEAMMDTEVNAAESRTRTHVLTPLARAPSPCASPRAQAR